MARIVACKGTAQFLPIRVEIHLSLDEAKSLNLATAAPLTGAIRDALDEHLKGGQATRSARNNVPV